MAEIVVGVVLVVLGVAAGVAAAPAGGGAPWRVAVGAPTALAGVVVLLVGRGALQRAVDEPVLAWATAVRTPARIAVAEALSLYGGTLFTGGVAVLVAAVLARRGRTRVAVVWVAAVVLGATTIFVVKRILDRPRPPAALRLAEESTPSLPSGHALMAALGLALAAAGARMLVRGAWRWVVVVVAVGLVAGIGASRVHLGVHWPSDVLSGWLLGAGLAAAAVLIARRDARAPSEAD